MLFEVAMSTMGRNHPVGIWSLGLTLVHVSFIVLIYVTYLLGRVIDKRGVFCKMGSLLALRCNIIVVNKKLTISISFFLYL